ncbi:hypothetical protein LCGC14_0960650 [marine sediment metagenome]|uniref:PD-(D/E)XK endonuclease-like domain-containing protein n=1 Tax=marine sediment metagenome TaxID=412755 RepID=A0A0F9P0R0_9ZZZZ
MGKQKHWQLSASSIACFKTCPFQYFLKYIKHIRKDVESEPLRYGTNWHKVMEVIGLPPGETCSCVDKTVVYPIDFNCLICNGTGTRPDDIMLAVARVIDDAYSRMPASMDPVKWAVERAKLLYSAAGYNWYYADKPLVPILTEYKFDSPVPGKTGRMIPNTNIVGGIDKITVVDEVRSVVDFKSTASSINPESKYWGSLNLDTQTNLYLYIVRLLQQRGLMPDLGGEVTGLYYDVYHKPGISPKKLTISDSKKFVEDGMYFTQRFEIIITYNEGDNPSIKSMTIGGHDAVLEPAKKEGQFTIRETPEMYGARLLADIAERPEYYFVRHPIPKTDADLEKFHKELLSVLISMRSMYNMDSWYHCEKQCEATYHCDYIDICYNGIDPDGELPDGLVRHEKKNEGSV